MLAMEIPIPYDWFFLGLRLAFAGLLYLFLWQVLRVTMRDLRQTAQQPQRKRASRAKLIVVDPAESSLETGTSFSINSKTTIGRHPDCSIAIDEPFLSAIHARFEARDLAWYVTDLDSTNGTFVNGRAVKGTVYIES